MLSEPMRRLSQVGGEDPLSGMIADVMDAVESELTQLHMNDERKIQSLEKKMRDDERQQEQKDLAQDHLIEMKFDSLRLELDARATRQDLQELKKVVLSRVQHAQLELGDEIKSIASGFREQLTADTKRLQAHLEQATAANDERIRLICERIDTKASQEAELEKRHHARLAALEHCLQLDGSGQLPETVP